MDIGERKWRSVRNRLDNLCIGFFGAETKSGAAVARELAKRISPGVCGSIEEMYRWAQSHIDRDPILAVVDDFAGTGNTLVKGFEQLWDLDKSLFTELAKEGRIICCLQSAFSDAILYLDQKYPGIEVLPIRIFGDEVRGLSEKRGHFQ